MTTPDPAAPPADAPLADLRIVTTALNLPGPLAAARLRDLGARVTTVLPPAGDPHALYAPAWFAQMHEGMDVLTLDLRQDAARSRMGELLAAADLFLTSSGPSTMRRLGLSPEELSAAHPRLCSVAAVGRSGPGADQPGHALTFEAEVGLVGPEGLPRTFPASIAAAERVVAEAMVALWERDRTGRGSHRQVAITDLAALLAQPLVHGMTRPEGLGGGGNPAYNVYPAAEGHVALAVVEPPRFAALTAELGIAGDAASFREAFAARTATEWEDWATERGYAIVALRP